MASKINVVAAIGYNGALGYKRKLPWHDPQDLKHFRFTTANSLVVVGSKTWDTVKHLQGTHGREFICATSRYVEDSVLWTNDQLWLRSYAGERPIWIAGGAETYRVLAPWVDGKILLTRINYDGPYDTVFPYAEYAGKSQGITLLLR